VPVAIGRGPRPLSPCRDIDPTINPTCIAMAAQCEIEVAEAVNLGQHPKTLRGRRFMVCDTQAANDLGPPRLPCTNMSMFTYRTSRSPHFPFWAVAACSLSGAHWQPDLRDWPRSVNWIRGHHHSTSRKLSLLRVGCSLFLLSNPMSLPSQGGPGPTALSVHLGRTWAVRTAQVR